MFEYNDRNPFLILVFTFIGMVVRFAVFYLISSINGINPKKLLYFSEGFKQIVYNLLLTFLIFTTFVFYLVFDIVNL